MAKHMSIRLAWHDEGWNGHVCKNPCANSYCVGRHSYPGDLIASSRDLQFESEHAGESCAKLNQPVACALSVNAFGSELIRARVDIPDFWGKNSASPAIIELPPHTCCTWCYEEMYNDIVKNTNNPNRKYDYDKRRDGAEKYFSQFESGKSLVFYYAGYSNPFSENEEQNYVIAGISRVKDIAPMRYYENATEKIRKDYGGGFVWQRSITSNYPNEGFCIPFWKYRNDENVLNRLVIKPLNRTPFKYGSRVVENDDAIEVINQLIVVVDYLIEIGDDTEDWLVRRDWLNQLLNELWNARGPYPGFASVLEAIGLSCVVSTYISLSDYSEMKSFRDDVIDFLEERRDDICGISVSDVEKRKIRREYKLMGAECSSFALNILSRFHLTAAQVKSIISDERGNVSISATIQQLIDNPYIIFEQYQGNDPDDYIPFYKIDNGIIPSPDFGLTPIFDSGATERLRALCVDELKRIPAHSYVKALFILNSINARLDRFPEWKRYVFKLKNFDIDQNILDEALVQHVFNDEKYLYLKDVYDDERTVETVIRELADRPNIQLRMGISEEKFKSSLIVPDSILAKKESQRYGEIINNQAKTCMKIFTKPVCVLSGSAGTGKTTVIKALLENILRVHGSGTSFLLMAPTGKASERIKAQTKQQSSTIHSFLAKNGWINDNFTFKRVGGSTGSDFNTIIIDECSMIDLSLFAALFRSINWNSVQRLILVGDPNQLPPIGRGKVFSDIIDWLGEEYPDNIGKLTDNIRQLQNKVEGSGCGILDLAEIFIQENQRSDNQEVVDDLKMKKEKVFNKIQFEGNGDVETDLGVYFWQDQEDLENMLINIMASDIKTIVKQESTDLNKLWFSLIKQGNGFNPEVMQVLSPYCGEFYGINSLNQLLQNKLNNKWTKSTLDEIGYFDKVIQIKNRPQSDLAYAYNHFNRNIGRSEVYNGEIGLSMPHFDDANKAKEAYDQNTCIPIKRLSVKFSGETREIKRYLYGDDLGTTEDGKYIPTQSVQENLDLAYAISVHKSQGSEFDYVYIVLPKRDSHLLSMELLYTAVTRAQKKVTLFIEQDVSPLSSLSRVEKSAIRPIQSSVFKFIPVPDDVFNSKGWHESSKRIATISDYLVRSKSEAIITNMLCERNIPFEYEKELYAEDGTMYLPDFTVTFRGETYYWEHVGRTHDRGYMAHWAEKEKWYNQHFPGKLLVTYESNNLSKDAEEMINSHM